MARSVRLEAHEVWQLIAGAHTGVLTSLRRDGMPISLPVWFVAFDERVYVAGPSHTKKFARVAADERVAFLVETGKRWSELVGVHLTGTAAVVTDGVLLARIAAALDAKYDGYRTPRSEMPSATRAHYNTTTTTIEIVPDPRILSWDNGRLFNRDPS